MTDIRDTLRAANISRHWDTVLAFLAFALVFGYLATTYGQDINWDQRNYHYYLPFAALDGSLTEDILPAKKQGFLNPTIYVPFYLLTGILPPIAVGFVLGALHGLLGGMTYLLAKRLLADIEPRRAFALLAAAIGVCGPIFLSEVGTSFADALIAPLILLGIWAAVIGCEHLEAARRADRHRPWLAGAAVALGMATGLKLTNALFAAALIPALLIVIPPRAYLRTGLAVGLGLAAGYAVTGGWWAVFKAFTYGNPIFPILDHLVGSGLAPDMRLRDTRFVAEDLRALLSLPFDIVSNGKATSELPVNDFRFALLAILAGLVALLGLGRRLEGRERGAHELRLAFPHRFIFTLFGTAFVIWALAFGIQRYFIPMAALTGIILVLLVARLTAGRKTRLVTAVGLGALCIAWPVRVDWGHTAWRDSWYDIDLPPALQQATDATYLMANGEHPYAYVIPAFPSNTRFARIRSEFPITPDEGLGRVAYGYLHDDVPARVLAAGPLNHDHRRGLASFGVTAVNPCWQFKTKVERLYACSLKRHDPFNGFAAARYEPGTSLSFAKGGNAMPYKIAYWSYAEDWGTWSEGNHAALMLDIAGGVDCDLRLKVDAKGIVGPRWWRTEIGVRVNGHYLAEWNYTRDANKGVRTVHIARDIAAARDPLYIEFRVRKPRKRYEVGLPSNGDYRSLGIGISEAVLEVAEPDGCAD